MPILSGVAARSPGPVTGPSRSAARVAGRLGFSADEWSRLCAVYGGVLLLHALGWGLFGYYSLRHPTLLGLGLAAWLLGLRHAFDADHIAAVDDTVRWLMQKGQRPFGVGLFFSLGHATVVFALVVVMITAASLARHWLPAAHELGAVIGAMVSGSYLWLIGVLNLLALLAVVRAWRGAVREGHGHAHLETLLQRRGLFNRIAGPWLQRALNHSWQMLPLGMLFGLGFDTASEVGLLVSAAGASAAGVPVLAVLSLPILFAAGMSLLDTTDGVLMVKVYDCALVNPLRKLYYNLVITALSVAVALLIGGIEWLQVVERTVHVRGAFFRGVAALDFSTLGCIVAGMFALAWLASLVVWRRSNATARR